jgi:hypothetical protein
MQPFSSFLLGEILEIICKSQLNPYIKIITKMGSGFNVNKGCKLILISAIYDM